MQGIGAAENARAMKHTKHATRTGLAVLGAAAAAGLVAGLAVSRPGRRGVHMASEPLLGDWLDVIKAEHLEVLDVLERLIATQSRATAKRKALLARLKLLLTKHAAEEENVVYPTLRGADSAAEAEVLIAEHALVKTALLELELMAPDDAAFMPRLRALQAELEAHMHKEETEIFPQLRKTLSPEADQQLTTLMLREGRLFV